MKSQPLILMFPFVAFFVGLVPAWAVDASSVSPVSAFEPAAQQLAQLVESFVTRDEIVGAELLVIHNRRPILHRAFGWKDREAKQPMARDTFFAVRSMTKPFTGMAAQVLIDEGKLELDAPVAKYLPSFDSERSRAITVRHVLTHRSGLPLGFVSDMSKPLSGYSGLRELADLSGARGPDFAPGSRFLYSDAGSDVLGAVVAAVSGQSLEEFVQQRILDPLELRDTFPEKMAVTPARRDRAATRYAGMTGSWTRYWGPTDAVLYPFLKGSGGLFSTPRDYARFLQFWLDRRTVEGKTLLAPVAFTRALEPVSRDVVNTGFSGAVCDYGQMWMLFRAAIADGAAFAFGHGGSDGTLAYAFPEQNLIVCYFTQSRGATSTRTFDEALSHLFVAPDAAAFARVVQPAGSGDVGEFLGLYGRDNRANSVGAMIAFNGRLAFELATRQVLPLRPTEERDRWVPERMPNDSLVFRREEGRVTGFTLMNRGNVVEATRFRPAADLPTIDDLMALRFRAVPPEQFAGMLPLRISSTLETQGRTVPVTLLVGRDGRSLQELDLGAAGKAPTWIAGERAWRQAPGAEGVPVELAGLERSQELAGALAVTMGDWRRTYAATTVLGREQFEGREVFRVRSVPREGMASTKLVSAETGAVLAEYGIAFVPGGGLQPTEVRYADFRVVEGVSFAFAQTVQLGGGLGAKFQIAITDIEPRAKVDEAALTVPVK